MRHQATFGKYLNLPFRLEVEGKRPEIGFALLGNPVDIAGLGQQFAGAQVGYEIGHVLEIGQHFQGLLRRHRHGQAQAAVVSAVPVINRDLGGFAARRLLQGGQACSLGGNKQRKKQQRRK